MSEADNLPKGYEYCNCHPETCNHFDGIVWVGNVENKIEHLACSCGSKKVKTATGYECTNNKCNL